MIEDINKDSKKIIKFISNNKIATNTPKEKLFLSFFPSDKFEVVEKIDKNKKNIVQVLPFESPDLLLFYQNKIYAIEHFCIDPSKKTRKGSSYKAKYNKKHYEQLIKNSTDDINKNGISVQSEEIETKPKYELLFKNLNDVFDDHYNKIDNYRKNINLTVKNIEEIKFIFLVEYDFAFPSKVDIDGKIKDDFIYLEKDIVFLNKLKLKTNLSGLFFNYSKAREFSNSEIANRFILIDDNNLDSYQVDNELVYDFNKVKLIEVENIMVSSIFAEIPSF